MQGIRPETRIHRMDQINLWLPTCEMELEDASNTIKQEMENPKYRSIAAWLQLKLKRDLQRYVHYWYVQEYKFNRMLEEKTTIAVLLSKVMSVEKLCPEMSAVSVFHFISDRFDVLTCLF